MTAATVIAIVAAALALLAFGGSVLVLRRAQRHEELLEREIERGKSEFDEVVARRGARIVGRARAHDRAAARRLALAARRGGAPDLGRTQARRGGARARRERPARRPARERAALGRAAARRLGWGRRAAAGRAARRAAAARGATASADGRDRGKGRRRPPRRSRGRSTSSVSCSHACAPRSPAPQSS